MNLELALYVLAGAAALISLLLTLLGIVLGVAAKQFMSKVDNMAASMDGMKLSIDSVMISLVEEKERGKAAKGRCEILHKDVDEKLEQHNQQIRENKTKIERHENMLIKLEK